MKKYIVYILTILFSVLFLWGANRYVCQNLQILQGDTQGDIIKAKVERIVERKVDEYTLAEQATLTNTTITFTAKALQGERTGQTVYGVQAIDSMFAMQQKEVAPGDVILIQHHNDSQYGAEYMLMEFVRTDGLWLLGLVLMIFLVVFGRVQGVNTILSLVLTVLSLFAVLVPAALSGQNLYAWSLGLCAFIIVMTLLVIYGVSQKSICAAIGCFSGVLACALLVLIMDRVLGLTGVVDEEAMFLTMLQNPVDLKAITFASIVVGAVGAIMDVAISISSALNEIHVKAPKETWRGLVGSGITIGRDMMGTMANTLVLAYIGSSFSTTLLLVSYSDSLTELMNREVIIVEILQALVGSFGILLTIPLASVICACLYTGVWAKKMPQPPSLPVEEAGAQPPLDETTAAPAPSPTPLENPWQEE